MSFSLRFSAWATLLMLFSGEGLTAATVDAPNLGYIFDPASGAIRSISGIPGAAITGPGLMSAQKAVIAPGQRFGLLNGSEGEPLRIWRPDGSLQALEGVLFPERIVFSSAGTAAVLIRDSGRSLQVLTGLPDAPVVHPRTTAPEDSRVFAVNEDGDILTGGSLLWLLREQESPRQLTFSGPVSALAFQGSHALVAGDGRILLLRNLAGSTEYRTLATYGGDQAPITVHLMPDVTQAFAATPDGEVRTLSVEAGETARLACRCRPTGFQQLAGNSLFQINDAGDEPIWLLDVSAEPRLWFVPRPLPAADLVDGPVQ